MRSIFSNALTEADNQNETQATAHFNRVLSRFSQAVEALQLEQPTKGLQNSL